MRGSPTACYARASRPRTGFDRRSPNQYSPVCITNREQNTAHLFEPLRAHVDRRRPRDRLFRKMLNFDELLTKTELLGLFPEVFAHFKKLIRSSNELLMSFLTRVQSLLKPTFVAVAFSRRRAFISAPPSQPRQKPIIRPNQTRHKKTTAECDKNTTYV